MLENPVFVKEIKAKMRSRQPPAVQQAIAAIILLVLAWGYYEAIVYLVRQAGPEGGKDMWKAGVVVQTMLIWLLCPALASNAITQEKEQQTWEMLIFTRLTPVEIIFGKLVARVLPMIALLAAFFPFMLFCFARGQVAAVDFLAVYVNFAVWTVFSVTVSLFMSWAFRRTSAAIAMSYIVLFFLLIGTFLIDSTIRAGHGGEDSPILWINPARIAYALVESQNDVHSGAILAVSLLTFSAITVFLLWRMISRFHTFAVE